MIFLDRNRGYSSKDPNFCKNLRGNQRFPNKLSIEKGVQITLRNLNRLF